MAAAGGAVTVQKGVTLKTILIITLLIASLSILAALPLSFFFNGNMGDWFGNFPLDLLPPPGELPDIGDGEWEIPDGWELPDGWEDWDLPDGWEDWLDDLPDDWDGGLPPGDIPWWLAAGALGYLLGDGSLPGGGGAGEDGGVGGLPGMGGGMGNGLGPFGTGNTTVYVSFDRPFRYWRIRAYDYFEGTTWLIADNSTNAYTFVDTTGTNYTVILEVTYTQAGYGNLPLPHLWDDALIRSDLWVLDATGGTPVNTTWDVLEDEYGGVHWNATIGLPGTYYVGYNVTWNDAISLADVESNVYTASPQTFIADPPDSHDYLQIPDLSGYPEVVSDMQALATNPALASNNTYETAKAVMEYFKTRWWWTPYRAQIPGQDFDPGYLINNGFGTSADFASNYVMYLRSMNISSRLIWGGIGFQEDDMMSTFFTLNPNFPPVNISRLSHSHFWAEVWIPNANNTGGEWVQFDPNPFPPTMWMPNQSMFSSGEQIQINIRENDTRVETSHYTMQFDASVPYDTPQNPLTDLFDLEGTLVRDGDVLTTTWLNESVMYNYTDVTEDALVGTSSGYYLNHNFSASAPAGPHRFNASFYAVVNETIVTCNGTTDVNIITLNPHSIIRGPSDFFVVFANISDSSNNQPISDAELRGYVIEIDQYLNDSFGVQYTDSNGEVLSSYSFPSTQPEGVYNFTMRFNGTFTVDYPDPYPDYTVTVPGSASQSANETIIITSSLLLNLFANANTTSILPRAHTHHFYGYLTYDNLTGISGESITVWWTNSTGTYNICADVTNASGYYEGYYYIPTTYDDAPGSNDVQLYANFSNVWGNATTTPATYYVRCSNQTNITLSTDLPSFSYVVRGVTSIHVWGRLWDPQGIASTAGQAIRIFVNETMTIISPLLFTDANGYFDGNIQIPSSHAIGPYNLCAGFSGDWIFSEGSASVLPSLSVSTINDTHEVIVVASTILSKTSSIATPGRVVNPVPMIAGDPVYIGGYLLFDDDTGFGSQKVTVWWTNTTGTYNITTANTDGIGFYNATYNIGYSEPTNVDIKVNYSAGSLLTSYILNASADADPPIVWAVNVFIDAVTPGAVTRGQTQLQVSGWVIEKHGYLCPGETIYLTFDGSNVLDNNGQPVTAVTNGNGNFTANFIVSGSYDIKADYEVNATLTNSSFLYNTGTTGLVEVNCTTSITGMTVDRTGLLGENITITGRLVDSINQDLDGTIELFANGNSVDTKSVNGAFSWEVSTDDLDGTGLNNLTLYYLGSLITYSSFTEKWWNIPAGANLVITNIAGYSDLINLTLNAGSTITITGTLKDSASAEEIQNRRVEIYYNGSLLGAGSSNSQGIFAIEVTLPALEGSATIYANFTKEDGSETFVSAIITVSVITPQGIVDILLQFLPWIIGIVAGIVAVYASYSFYTRRTKKEKGGKLSHFIGSDLEMIKMKLSALQEGKRYREAIIFAYYNYLKLVGNYFDKPQRPSQTVREYAMDMVKLAKIPPTMIYPFTTLFEDARYGPKEMTSRDYVEAFHLFMTLNDRVFETSRLIAEEEVASA